MGRFSADTNPKADEAQLRAHRTLTPQQRYLIAAELSDEARDIALAGLRSRCPGIPQSELMRLFLEKVQGWRIPSAGRS